MGSRVQWPRTISRRTRAGGISPPVLVALLLAAGAAVLIFRAFPGPYPGLDGWYDDVPNGLVAAQVSGKPVMVLYTARWSGPSRELNREVLRSVEVADYLREEFIRVRIDLTNRSGPNSEIAAEYRVLSTPTVHIFDAGGRPFASRVGSARPSEFLGWLERCREQAE